jgi:hypothetical protein
MPVKHDHWCNCDACATRVEKAVAAMRQPGSEFVSPWSIAQVNDYTRSISKVK